MFPCAIFFQANIERLYDQKNKVLILICIKLLKLDVKIMKYIQNNEWDVGLCKITGYNERK